MLSTEALERLRQKAAAAQALAQTVLLALPMLPEMVEPVLHHLLPDHLLLAPVAAAVALIRELWGRVALAAVVTAHKTLPLVVLVLLTLALVVAAVDGTVVLDITAALVAAVRLLFV
jgi:hypothetical protein